MAISAERKAVGIQGVQLIPEEETLARMFLLPTEQTKEVPLFVRLEEGRSSAL